MGYSGYGQSSGVTAHEHSAVAGDGGILARSVTIIDTPTLLVYTTTRALILG